MLFARAITWVVSYTVSFSFSPLGQIHLALGSVHLVPGAGSHRLTLRAKVTGSWLAADDPAALAQALLTGAVWIDQPSFWVGGFEPEVLTVRGYQVSEELILSLSDDQLIAMDGARGDGDVVLRLDLQATLLGADPSVYPVNRQQAQFRIPRSMWLELLDRAGAAVAITLRVPSPLADAALALQSGASVDDAASLVQATTRLRQARAELRDHQWEHCVATCRRVLENLDRLVKFPPAGPLFKLAADQRTQDQRWAAIYYDIKGLASAAHHDDDTTDGFAWSRQDAEAILAATGGLLVLYAAR